MGAQKRGITLHDIFNMTERRIMTFGCTEKSERHQEKKIVGSLYGDFTRCLV
jgi:hypothetical protein